MAVEPGMTDPTFTVSDDVLAAYGEWTECAAFRFVNTDDGQVVFEVTNDLERITAPDCAS